MFGALLLSMVFQWFCPYRHWTITIEWFSQIDHICTLVVFYWFSQILGVIVNNKERIERRTPKSQTSILFIISQLIFTFAEFLLLLQIVKDFLEHHHQNGQGQPMRSMVFYGFWVRQPLQYRLRGSMGIKSTKSGQK